MQSARVMRATIPPEKGARMNRHHRKQLIAQIEAYLAFWAIAKEDVK